MSRGFRHQTTLPAAPAFPGTFLVSLALLVACFYGTPPASAQEEEEVNPGLGKPDYAQPWQVVMFGHEAGINQQRIFDIAFETNGNAWLAADDGLHRYDGYAWQKFGIGNGLPSTFTRAVLVDSANRLWVGSDAGAGTWDPRTHQYESHGSALGLANGNVREIDEDPDGTLWFSCDQWPESKPQAGGLSRLRNGQWQTYRQTNGLPLDYLIGYYRDGTGRQFALTPHGWSQWLDTQWGPPRDPGMRRKNVS